jgi:hypothetical protein
MKRIILLTAIAAFACVSNVSAQEDPDKYYIRNSLYMLKLDEPCPKDLYKEPYKIMSATFDTINFANAYERYNDFALTERTLDLSKLPTATQAEQDAIGKMTKLEQITDDILREQGLKNALSENEYAARLLKYFEKNHYAQNLIAKWYNKPGTAIGKTNFDDDLTTIFELGVKGLSQEALSNAKATENLISVAKGSTNKLLSNTYVCVVRYGYMDAKEAIAISTAVAQMTLGNNSLAQLALNTLTKTLEKKIKGYFVRANAYLFKLDWNQELQNKLELEYWDKKNQAKLLTDPAFKLTYVGKSSKRAPAAASLKSSATLDKLIARGTARATDAAIAALQRDHEEFRPMTSLHVINGKLAAYIGMKEGVEAGDKFNVYEAVQSANDPNVVEWKEIGTIKVGKEVWDNRAGAGEEIDGAATDKEDGKASSVPYTVFSGKPGKMGEGCMIRLAK